MSHCKNPKCSTSTGIHEGLTFGSGRLNRHGYWEFPCRTCAAKYDRERPQRIRRMLSEIRLGDFDWRGFDEYNFIAPQMLNYLKRHEWAFMLAWPYANQDVAQLTKEFQEEDAADLQADEEFELEIKQLFPEDYAHETI